MLMIVSPFMRANRLKLCDALLQTLSGGAPVHERLGGN
jgi:hypothetical protein